MAYQYRWTPPWKDAASKPRRQPVLRPLRMKRQRIGYAVLAGVLLLVFGFSVGRLTAPEPVGKLTSLRNTPFVQAGVSQDERMDEAEIPWNLVLVNAWNALPKDYDVDLTELINDHAIDSRVYPSMQQMLDDARAQGLEPLICSSYRSHDYQQRLYDNKVDYYVQQGYSDAEAKDAAAHWVQRPGTSEHQLGLAVDIVDQSYQVLDEAQQETPVQIWLMEHCAEYGFILRYPTDKSHITGVGYEPWHYRYVGIEAAQEIMGQGICLEEYLYPDQYE